MRVLNPAALFRFMRFAVLVYCTAACCLTASSTSLRAQTPKKAVPVAAAPVVTAPAHRAELERALKALRRWQQTTPPTLKELRRVFPDDTRTIQRNDGAKQNVSGDDWAQRIDAIEYSRGMQRVTRRDLRALKAIIENRLRELDAWAKTSYQPPDAQSIIKSLDDNGTISTAPPLWQVWWQNAKDTITAFMERIFSWRAPTGTALQIEGNPTWIKFFFASTLAALLVVLAWWLWQTFGGQWRLGASRREVRFSESEEELLLLPPDELRLRADKLAAQGDFAQALRHRYVAILLMLDGHGIWRYDTRRTNWEHIGALRKKRETRTLVAPLSSLTFRFDRVRYGEMVCTELDWTQFAQEATALETLAASTRETVNAHATSADAVRADASGATDVTT